MRAAAPARAAGYSRFKSFERASNGSTASLLFVKAFRMPSFLLTWAGGAFLNDLVGADFCTDLVSSAFVSGSGASDGGATCVGGSGAGGGGSDTTGFGTANGKVAC